eukprot:3948703-Prymnesium_polylepis.2
MSSFTRLGMRSAAKSGFCDTICSTRTWKRLALTAATPCERQRRAEGKRVRLGLPREGSVHPHRQVVDAVPCPRGHPQHIARNRLHLIASGVRRKLACARAPHIDGRRVSHILWRPLRVSRRGGLREAR